MRYLQIIAIISLLAISGMSLSSCKHQEASTSVSGVSYSGGNGTSYEDAVVIHASNETAGVQAEYDWLKDKYPGYSLKMQSLNTKDGKKYDVMDIKTADGEDKTIYFDITLYFGKW